MERDEDGQRPCARGIWCASSVIVNDRADGTGRRVPAYGTRAFCERDRGLVAACLDELPAQYAHLHAELGNPAVRAQPVRVPFGPRVPIRVDIEALMRAITEATVSWHERVAMVARLSFPDRRRRDGYAVSRAVDVLAAHLDAMLALEAEPVTRAWDLRTLRETPPPDSTPGVVHAVYAEICLPLDGGDAGMEIINLRHLCRATLGETKAKPEMFDGIPCRECEEFALERAEPPSDPNAPAMRSACGSCGGTMNDEEFEAWVDRYGKWAESADLRACRHCQRGDHKQCAWDSCPCRFTGHAVAA